MAVLTQCAHGKADGGRCSGKNSSESTLNTKTTKAQTLALLKAEEDAHAQRLVQTRNRAKYLHQAQYYRINLWGLKKHKYDYFAIRSFNPTANSRFKGKKFFVRNALEYKMKVPRSKYVRYLVVSSKVNPKHGALRTIGKTISKRKDITYSKFKTHPRLGRSFYYLNYMHVGYQQPYAAANYIFIRNSVYYHLTVINYLDRGAIRDRSPESVIYKRPIKQLEKLVKVISFR